MVPSTNTYSKPASAANSWKTFSKTPLSRLFPLKGGVIPPGEAQRVLRKAEDAFPPTG